MNRRERRASMKARGHVGSNKNNIYHKGCFGGTVSKKIPK